MIDVPEACPPPPAAGLAAVSEAEEEEAGLVVGRPEGQRLSLSGAGSGHSFVSRLGSLRDLSPKIAQLLWRSSSSGSGGCWWGAGQLRDCIVHVNA